MLLMINDRKSCDNSLLLWQPISNLRLPRVPWLFTTVATFNNIIECFHMTSRWPSWCPKTMKWQPSWYPKPILWELNSFLMQMLSFVPINLHKCWPREWKHSIISLFHNVMPQNDFYFQKWTFKLIVLHFGFTSRCLCTLLLWYSY